MSELAVALRDWVLDPKRAAQARGVATPATPASPNGANAGKSSPKPAVQPQELQSDASPPDVGEVSSQTTKHERLLDLYSSPLDSEQRSYHWLVLVPPREIEEHFQDAITRAQLAKKYPPPAVLIPFVTAADMASLWSPLAK